MLASTQTGKQGQLSRLVVLAILLSSLLAACRGAETPLPQPEIIPAASQTAFQPAPQASATTAPSATMDPYAGLSIEDLAARSYGGGELIALEQLASASKFLRYLISYPSDGLTINGFIDLPYGEGPFPVVLVMHGYVDPAIYTVQTYTEGYAAAFANAGFIAIHPNYRNYPPSDSGDNLFRVGYAVDAMNLIAIVREQAGQPGALENADPDNIFLFGHSMGGGIIQRVITVGAPVNGAVLYGSMSGDERQNFEHIFNVLSDSERGFEELDVPDQDLMRISPAFFYERIDVPVSIHHGDIDDVVPLQWSLELCDSLDELGKEVECYTYHNMPHTFYGLNNELLIRRSIDFFLAHMREQ